MAEGEKIVQINIEEEMKAAYIDYSMSVIVSRALPDVRDGLKPVHRRILFAMNDMGMFHNKPFKKSARIVGEVLGKYHHNRRSHRQECKKVKDNLGQKIDYHSVRPLPEPAPWERFPPSSGRPRRRTG